MVQSKIVWLLLSSLDLTKGDLYVNLWVEKKKREDMEAQSQFVIIF